MDFSNATRAIITLLDGDVITLIGMPIADKHWVEVTASTDAALAARTQGRAFEVASYRYDAIFRPLERLLVPKESKGAGKSAAPGHGAVVRSKPEPGAKPATTGPKPSPAPGP
jgi:hypothetical protein